MKTRQIGKSGITASAIALGTWSMGGDAQWGAQDDEASLKAIHSAVEHGINTIDTAPAYGFGYSERLVGRAIREIPREKLVIQTKCGFWWRDDEGAVIIERDGKVCRRKRSKCNEILMREGQIIVRIVVIQYIESFLKLICFKEA